MGPGVLFGLGLLGLLGFSIATARKAPTAAEVADAMKNKALEALKSGDPSAMAAVAKELGDKGLLAETANALRAAAAAALAKLGKPPAAAPPGVTPGMSPELKQQVAQLLATETRPDVLENVALALEAQGHVPAALALRAKAKTLRAAQATGDVLTQIVDALQGKPPGTTPTPPITPAPPPAVVPPTPPAAGPPPPPPAQPSTYQIKVGDFPYLVAQKLTGNANRWKELPAVNPGMVVKTVVTAVVRQPDGTYKESKTTLLDPWYPGLTVNIPASWVKPGAAPAPSPPAPAPAPAPPPVSPEPSPGVPGMTPPPGWPATLAFPPPRPSFLPAGIPWPIYQGAAPAGWPTWLAWPPAPPPGWPLTVPWPLPMPGAAAPAVTPPAVAATYTIKPGDVPYAVAKRFTGDANRWKQIPSANPGMKVVTKSGVTLLVPWSPGLTINLPASWGAKVQAAA